jgi:O-antigen/teichoic acid export membrane protein
VLQTKFHSFVLTGSAWYLLEKMARLFGSFLIGAWVARYLGPESYGMLAYTLALVALLGFLGSWGVESLVVRDLVDDSLKQRQIISTYFFIRLAGASLVPFLAIVYLQVTHANAGMLMVMTLLCSTSVMFGAFDAADCWLQARHKARVTSSIRLDGFVISGVVKCFLIIGEASVAWFAFAVLIETGVMAALYCLLLWQHDLLPTVGHWSFAEFKRTIIDGKMMVLSGLMVTIYSKIDILVIGSVFSKEILAPYAIAGGMCAAWNMVGMSLVQAWAPHISLAMAISQEEYINALRKMLLVMLGLSVVGGAFLSVFSQFIFDFLFGKDFLAGVPIFNILIWSSVFVFLGVATSQIIVNERIYWISLFRTIVGAVLSLVCIIPVASNFGVVGVAWLVVLTSASATLSIVFSASARSTLRKVFVSI